MTRRRRAVRAVVGFAGRRARAVGRVTPVLLDVAGFGLVAYGVWLIYPPAGFIAAGVGASLLGLRFSSSDNA